MIKLTGIHKSYTTDYTSLHVLKGVDLEIKSGEMVAIMGASGSGKSTLLNIIGLLDVFDEGDYILDGASMSNLSPVDAAFYRNRKLGFIFQASNLITYKNIIENVALPLLYRGEKKKTRNELALQLLDVFGLRDWGTHYPNELSGGQKQRVAIARALISDPEVIIADEPTGQLDSKTSLEVLQILKDIHRTGKTVIIVTHEQAIAEQAARIIHIQDGVIL